MRARPFRFTITIDVSAEVVGDGFDPSEHASASGDIDVSTLASMARGLGSWRGYHSRVRVARAPSPKRIARAQGRKVEP